MGSKTLMMLKQGNKKEPLFGKITEKKAVTALHSTKETYHLRLEIADSASSIDFKVGDSIAVFTENDPDYVAEFLQKMGSTGNEIIVDSRSGETLSVLEFFKKRANFARLTTKYLEFFKELTKIQELLESEEKAEFLNSHEPLDLFNLFPETQKIPAEKIQEFCALFAPLLPRFYSISSSPLISQNSVDLLVTISAFHHQGKLRFGVASHYLCHLAQEGKDLIPFYVQPTHSFLLAPDEEKIIMVGPGTGVAPFRAFMQERAFRGIKDKSWLFFGERHRKSDFYYEEEWKALERESILRLDAVFSRDGEHAYYVQNRMRECKEELWQWLSSGAYFYVCGDAGKMAKDVDLALVDIAMEEGKMSHEEATSYFKEMRKAKRYLLDVY